MRNSQSGDTDGFSQDAFSVPCVERLFLGEID